jgi:hypothetical protein
MGDQDRSFWEQACNASTSRPLPQLQQANDVANGIAVSLFALESRPTCPELTLFLQIVTCALASLLSGIVYMLEYRLLRWRLSGKEVEGDHIWKNLRRFSGWTCTGCILGAITFSMFMQRRHLEFESRLTPNIVQRRFYELQAASYRYYSAFSIFYPAHLLCVIFALNLLLKRVSDHASHSYYNVARDHSAVKIRFDWRDCVGQYALYYLVRNLHKVAMLLCAFDVIARASAAGFRAQSADEFEQAAAATDRDGRDTGASKHIVATLIKTSLANASISVAVSYIFETTVLVLEAIAFLLFFPACIVMFRRVERRLHNIIQEMNLRSDYGNAFLPFEFSPPAANGSETQVELPIVEARQFLQTIKSSATAQRRRFLFCLLFVQVSLVALASHAIFVTYFNLDFFDDGFNPSCQQCGPCQAVGYVIHRWYVFTPFHHCTFVILWSGTFSRPSCCLSFSPCAPRCRWCWRCG